MKYPQASSHMAGLGRHSVAHRSGAGRSVQASFASFPTSSGFSLWPTRVSTSSSCFWGLGALDGIPKSPWVYEAMVHNLDDCGTMRKPSFAIWYNRDHWSKWYSMSWPLHWTHKMDGLMCWVHRCSSFWPIPWAVGNRRFNPSIADSVVASGNPAEQWLVLHVHLKDFLW